MNICFCLLFAFATEPTENSLYTELCFLHLAVDDEPNYTTFATPSGDLTAIK
jgi:hypothetical protein